jgi:hypothetical protein
MGFCAEEKKLNMEGVARCRFFLQGVKDSRSSNECSEEFIYRHDSNSFLDTLIPAFFHNQIIISF